MSPVWTPYSAMPQRELGVLAERLLQGERGTAQTIAKMRELVDQALRDPAIVRLAMDIVGSAPQFDDAAEAQAIYDWMTRHIRFTKDPVGKEKLYPPAELLKTGAGDCDDVSMLMATLLMAVGYPARFITVAASAAAPDQFSHVYVEAEVPPHSGQWIPMDAARPDSQFCFEPPMYYRKRAWPVDGEGYEDLSGTKIHVRGNVHTIHLGDYPRFRSLQGSGGRALGDYPRFRSLQGTGGQALGQDGTSALVATIPAIETGAAQIIAAARGGAPIASPYASFQTRHTPGWGIPAAGYQSPPQQTDMSWLWIVGLGLLAWKAFA